MPLQLDLENVLQFFTFLSPIFISVFLLFQSIMKGDVKGIVWMLGSFIAWILGMAIKSMFHKLDDNAVAALVSRGANVPAGTRKWQRTPIRMNMPVMPGSTRNNTPDYCSVFSGPFSNSLIYNTSMPSLNALFHAFTITYIAFGVANNPHPSANGITFLIILGITAIINPLGNIEQSVDLDQSGYVDFEESRKIQPTIFSKYGNKIFVMLILLYIFLIFSFNKIKNEQS